MALNKKTIVELNAYLGTKKNTSDTTAYINSAQFDVLLAEALAQEGESVDLYVCSGGGSIFEGNKIINSIKKSTKDVFGHADAVVASMGYYILTACKKIYAAKNTMVMVHGLSSKVEGTLVEMEAGVEFAKKLQNTLVEALAERTGLSVDEVNAKWMDGQDHWYTAEEALAEGLIDGIEDFEAKNQLPEAATKKLKYAEFVAQFKPISTPAAEFSNEEEWNLSYMISDARNLVDDAERFVENSSNATLLALANQIVNDVSKFVIALTVALYGEEIEDATAEAKLEELTAKVNAKRFPQSTAELTAVNKKLTEIKAALAVKDRALTKVTGERDAANTELETAKTSIEELEAKILDREVDPEGKKTGGENPTPGGYSWTSAKLKKS